MFLTRERVLPEDFPFSLLLSVFRLPLLPAVLQLRNC